MKKLILFVLIAALLGGGAWFYWTTTPQYAMQQTADAIKEHDLARFHNWVDVASVADAAVEDLLAEPVRNSGGPDILGRVVGLAVISLFKPTVVESMRKQIDTWVAHKPPAQSGSAADDDEEQSAAEQPKGFLNQLVQIVKPPSLKQIFADYGFTKKNYRGLGGVDTNGNVAHVGLRFFSPKVNREVEVQFEMNNGSGHWQIERISNLQKVVATLAGGS